MQVISNLLISKIEMRTEDDLSKYSHGKEVEVMEIPPSPILKSVRLALKANVSKILFIFSIEMRSSLCLTFRCNIYVILTHIIIEMLTNAANLCFWNQEIDFEHIHQPKFDTVHF
jgi:ERCC4-related helicase